MIEQNVVHSCRARPIEHLIEIVSSNVSASGPVARAGIARAECSDRKRASLRALADQMLVTLAKTMLDSTDSDWSVCHRSDAAPRLLYRQKLCELRASVAYSECWVAASVAADADIGVDIQVHDDRPRRADIARFLRLDVASDAGSQQFFRSWSLREALAKSQGGSVLTRDAAEADLAPVCSRPNQNHMAGEFEAIVRDIRDHSESLSFALVIRHHQAVRHCA